MNIKSLVFVVIFCFVMLFILVIKGSPLNKVEWAFIGVLLVFLAIVLGYLISLIDVNFENINTAKEKFLL